MVKTMMAAALAACALGAGAQDLAVTHPVSERKGVHENQDWFEFRGFHYTDAKKDLPWMMVRGRQVLEKLIDSGGIRKTYCTNVHGDVTFSCDGRAIRVSCDPENLYIHDPK